MTALGTTGLARPGTPTRQLPVERSPLHRRALSRLLVVARVLAPFAVLVLLWQGSAMALGLSNYLYPRPALVFRTFGVLLQHGILPSYIESSMWRWLLGVVAGVALAVPVAVALSLSRLLHRTFFPIVNFFMAIVELAWIPLFVLWFGYGFEVIVLSVGYVAFFPVVAQTVRGITQIPRATIAATRTLGASRRQLVRHVLLPGALPNLVAGLRIGAGYGFRSLIGAEMIAAHSGLGYMIFQSRENQLTQRTIAGMIVIGLLWLGIDRLYLRPFERATVQRWGLAKEGAP
jgi:ABC-type nitrate/sulfonate/bicarbonate transport system permease component